MLPGIDPPRVSAWLLAHIEGLKAPFEFELIVGGRSNMTYAVADAAGHRLILRRPPISHVLSTAHDMHREYRIISALQGTRVPVPTAFGYCADESVTGRPFYVMDLVEGHVLRSADQAATVLDEPSREAAGYDLVDVLVAIHQVDPDAAGVGDLAARRYGYIERQLRRWHKQFEQSQEQQRQTGVHRPLPLVDEVYQRLAGRVPAQRGATIVHGDYRLDNTIVSAEGRIRAVLDWELCTLGDPLADLGTMLMYWADGPPVESGSPPVTALAGFPQRAQLMERYAARSGTDLSNLAYYEAFANWRLACILDGVYTRYATGAMGGDRSPADAFAETARLRAHRAMELLAG